MASILLVEDEVRIATFVEKGLRANGFTVDHVSDGKTGLELALGGEFCLIILDLGLPDQDGLELLDALRGQGVETPIVILTARDDLNDKVAGFEGGADDYLTKPFRFEELLVRIKARLRDRPTAKAVPEPSAFLGNGLMQLDVRSRQVQVNRTWVELPAREFTLAELFFQNEGQVLSREQILSRVWGYDYDPGSNIVDVYVGYLRKKLGNKCIETVRGQGYRFRLPS